MQIALFSADSSQVLLREHWFAFRQFGFERVLLIAFAYEFLLLRCNEGLNQFSSLPFRVPCFYLWVQAAVFFLAAYCWQQLNSKGKARPLPIRQDAVSRIRNMAKGTAIAGWGVGA